MSVDPKVRSLALVLRAKAVRNQAVRASDGALAAYRTKLAAAVRVGWSYNALGRELGVSAAQVREDVLRANRAPAS